MLKGREESDTDLSHVCRHLHSEKIKGLSSATSTADESHGAG